MNEINQLSSYKLLELPFDQYQRYKIVQQVIAELRGHNQPLRVLDIGGSPATLKRFLPDDLVFVVDRSDQGGLDILADGLSIPFGENVFDVVVSIDTLEHIPAQKREGFIKEILRVARNCIILGAPFKDEQVVKAEEVFQEMIWARYGEGYNFIEEHRSNGLPDLEQTQALLQKHAFTTAILPNGYLHRWLVAISAFFLLQWRFHDPKLNALVNAYYNAYFYDLDKQEPSYRKIIVASKDANVSRLREKFCSPAPPNPAEQAIHLQALNLFIQVIGETWSERAMKLEQELAEAHKAAQIQSTENLQAKQEIIQIQGELARVLEEYQAQANLLDIQNQRILNSEQKFVETNRRLQDTQHQLQDTQHQLQDVQLQLQETRQQLEDHQKQLQQTEQQVINKEQQLAQTIQLLQDKSRSLQNQEQLAQNLEAQLQEIYSSAAWTLIQRLWRLRLKIAPHHSTRERLIQTATRSLRPRPSPKRTMDATQEKISVSPSLIEAREAHNDTPDTVSTNDSPAIPVAYTPVPALIPSLPAASKPVSYDIIVFPIIDWDFRFQRPQQIARLLAQQGHRIFYIKTKFGSSMTVRTVHLENIYEITLPAPRSFNIYQECMDDASLEQTKIALMELRSYFAIQEAICMVDLPFWQPLALKLKKLFDWKLVYDCMDHIAGFSNTTAEILALETALSQSSDLVITTSRLLLAEQSKLNSNCIFVPNAGEYDHFRFLFSGIPAAIKDITHPVIGYYGAIADWFDTRLVAEIAKAAPNWSIVLIGDTCFADLAPIVDLPNIYLLGEQPYQALPPYLHQFDVCIIPFKKTPLTDSTNPVKLFEFLSAGKPVVATDLNELGFYQDYIRLASSPEEWMVAIKQALEDTSPNKIQMRIEFARENTWQERVARIDQAIQSLYPRASILILTYNNLDYTRLCLNSIFQNTAFPNFEVIVVDNASNDGTVEYLKNLEKEHENMRVLYNQSNLGFAAGNNQAAQAAHGEYLVFLNNDTVVPPAWLSILLKHLKDPKIGLVGCVTNWSGNESRIPVWYKNLSEMAEFAEQRAKEFTNRTFDIPVVALYCAAMHRNDFDEIGRLDERFAVGMFEDDDLAMRIRNRGLRVVCAEDAFVHHWGKTSFNKLDEKIYNKIFEENKRRFEEKWDITWTPHRYRQNQ